MITIKDSWIRTAKDVIDRHASKLAKGNKNFDTLVDDLKAQGYLSIEKAKIYWNPDRGAKFYSYATFIALRDMREYFNTMPELKSIEDYGNLLANQEQLSSDTVFYGDMSDALILEEEKARVRNALQNLKNPYKRVIIERTYNNKTHEEINEELGMSVRSSHYLYKRGIEELRHILGVE